MTTSSKILVLAALVGTIVAAVALKQNKASDAPLIIQTTTNSVATARLPKLLDLGAGKCVPCKMMAPILEELKNEYAGRMNVEFIDVWVNPEAAKPYDIEVIPTQIFYDAEGKELYRHVGFLAKADILAKWKELGIDLPAK